MRCEWKRERETEREWGDIRTCCNQQITKLHEYRSLFGCKFTLNCINEYAQLTTACDLRSSCFERQFRILLHICHSSDSFSLPIAKMGLRTLLLWRNWNTRENRYVYVVFGIVTVLTSRMCLLAIYARQNIFISVCSSIGATHGMVVWIQYTSMRMWVMLTNDQTA